jgi:hypothetical protein
LSNSKQDGAFRSSFDYRLMSLCFQEVNGSNKYTTFFFLHATASLFFSKFATKSDMESLHQGSRTLNKR